MPRYLALLAALALLADAYFLDSRNILLAARVVTVAGSVIKAEASRYLPN